MNITSKQSFHNYIQPAAVAEEPVNLECKSKPITPEIIDTMIEEEIQKELALYNAQEEAFVDQCLKQNPIECRTRPSVRADPETTDPIKLKRNDACRRSRINGKIKKAKTKYQQQFLTKRMQQRAVQLQQWRKFIAETEMTLLNRGFSSELLMRLRTLAGMEKVKYHDLSELLVKMDSDNEDVTVV